MHPSIVQNWWSVALDVPVRTGWRETPLTEEELNPIRCMI
jgi:hypothetical protein